MYLVHRTGVKVPQVAISACYLCVVCFFYYLQVFVNSFAWICLGLVCSLVVVPTFGGSLGVVVCASVFWIKGFFLVALDFIWCVFVLPNEFNSMASLEAPKITHET